MGNVTANLPEWIQILAGLLIMVVAGVATRLGWASQAAKAPPEKSAEILGAVIDTRSVKVLVDQIDFAVDRITNLHEDRIRVERQSIDELTHLRRDIREMTESVDKLVTHLANERKGIYG